MATSNYTPLLNHDFTKKVHSFAYITDIYYKKYLANISASTNLLTILCPFHSICKACFVPGSHLVSTGSLQNLHIAIDIFQHNLKRHLSANMTLGLKTYKMQYKYWLEFFLNKILMKKISNNTVLVPEQLSPPTRPLSPSTLFHAIFGKQWVIT